MLGLDTSFSLRGKDVLSTFLDMPFWIWDPFTHRKQHATEGGYCCFNHVLSLPNKDGVSYPLFRFQKIIFDILEQNQNVWIKKARGLGLTTLILRYLTWKILFSSELDYKSIYVIAGNGNRSNHIDFAAHDIAYLFIDDADFMEAAEQSKLEQVISSCSVRSNCRTIMVSTPNQRGGLFEKIGNDETSGYTKLKLDYRYGIGTFYDSKFIETKKLEPGFDREYNIVYK
jgi:hypothetical protein